MIATSFSSSNSANLGNSGEAMVEIHKYSGHIVREQNQFYHYTYPYVPTVYACEFLVAFIWCLCKKYESFKR